MNFSPVSSRYLEKSGTLGTVTSNIYTKLHSKIVDRGDKGDKGERNYYV
jgi:hypothetical protein